MSNNYKFTTKFTVFDPEMKSSLGSEYYKGLSESHNSRGSAFHEYYENTFGGTRALTNSKKDGSPVKLLSIFCRKR